VDLVDNFYGVRGGALLGAHLDQLFVFLLGLDQHFAFGGIVAAGFFDVDVLAGLKTGDSHRSVPVIGRGDGDGVDIFLFKNFAEVFFGCGRLAHFLLHAVGEFVEDVAIDVAHVRDAGGAFVGFERGEVGVGAAVETDYGKVEAIVRADDTAVAFRGGTYGVSCGGGCKSVEKFTS
jgi:hypothetical protein